MKAPPMIQTREGMEADEERELAPFAVRSGGSRGRRFVEPAHAYRPEFLRDRDRILHSRAFRRLEYKTQVFVNGTADHYRTRLTHTIEMAAVSRTLARGLRVNEGLAEAIALAHDLGHSPFGHCGEDVLNELMKEEGGFDHNLQSGRIVEILEAQYPDFPGLNLTWEVRAGLRKHQASVPGAELDGIPLGPFLSVEAQIADLADDVTYYAHDVDDGMEAGLLSEEALNELDLWRLCRSVAEQQFPGGDAEALRVVAIRNLLDLQVEDVLRESARRLAEEALFTPEDVRSASGRLIGYSPEMRSMVEPLRTFLYREMYGHPVVAHANRSSAEMIRALFWHYVKHPECMGRKARARLKREGITRTACDYVAGCTDRYALEEHARFGLA